jgi:hypothetical protein
MLPGGARYEYYRLPQQVNARSESQVSDVIRPSCKPLGERGVLWHSV